LQRVSQDEKYFRQNCRENQNTHSMFKKLLFFENRAVCEIMWKNNVEPNGPQMIKCRKFLEWLIPKISNTHSEYVTFIDFYTATIGTRKRLNVTPDNMQHSQQTSWPWRDSKPQSQQSCGRIPTPGTARPQGSA
jgi:hypothetical protein